MLHPGTGSASDLAVPHGAAFSGLVGVYQMLAGGSVMPSHWVDQAFEGNLVRVVGTFTPFFGGDDGAGAPADIGIVPAQAGLAGSVGTHRFRSASGPGLTPKPPGAGWGSPCPSALAVLTGECFP